MKRWHSARATRPGLGSNVGFDLRSVRAESVADPLHRMCQREKGHWGEHEQHDAAQPGFWK